MPSARNKFSEKELRFINAIKSKNNVMAHQLLSEILAGDQLVMPGFDVSVTKKDVEKERRVKSVMYNVVKELKVPLTAFQTAFGRCPDSHLIVDALSSSNPLVSLNAIVPKLFYPLRPARALRVSDPNFAWDHYKGGDWIVQQKMDGWYGQIHIMDGKVVVYSRKGDIFSFTSNIEKNLSQLFKKDSLILECELISIDPQGNIAPRVDIKSSSNYVRAYFFDLLFLNTDLTRQPYEKRFASLRSVFNSVQDAIIKIITWEEVNSKYQFVGYFEKWNNINGLEGMIAKRPVGTYESDCMTKNFLKIKVKDTIDAVVLGYMTKPQSYLLGLLDEESNELVPFVWVTIPENQKDILAGETELHIQDLPPITAGGRTTEFRTVPDLIVEVEGDKIHETNKYPCGKKQTGKGWTLFAASIKQIRLDKGVDDITTVDTFLNLNSMAGYKK